MHSGWVKKLSDRYSTSLRRFSIFDCNLWLGTPEGFPLARELTLEELWAEMRAHSISGGLLSHWWGKTLSAQAGNRALAEKSALLPKNVFTIWTGLPLFPEDVPPIPGIGELHADMRGVRIFPSSHNYAPEDWILGGLCEWLQAHRMPLFVWHTEIDLRSLYSLAHRYPGLNFVLETQTKKILYHARDIFSLMRECSNIYIETSNFVGCDYIEFTVRTFGAHRLLYGSFLPLNDPFVGIGMLLDADIAEDEKALIASGNLKRMLEEVSL